MNLVNKYLTTFVTALTLGCATVPQQQTEKEKFLTTRGCILSKHLLDQTEKYALLACSMNGNKYFCNRAEVEYNNAKIVKKESCVDNLFKK